VLLFRFKPWWFFDSYRVSTKMSTVIFILDSIVFDEAFTYFNDLFQFSHLSLKNIFFGGCLFYDDSGHDR